MNDFVFYIFYLIKKNFNLSKKLKEIVEETNSVEEAMKYFAENYPSLILTKHKGFESNLKSYQKMKNSVTIDKAFFPPNS